MIRCPKCDVACWETMIRNSSEGLLWVVANRGYLVSLVEMVNAAPISVEAWLTVSNSPVSTCFLREHVDHELEVVSEYGEVVHGG